MKIDHIFLSFVVIGIVMLSMLYLISDINMNYDTNINVSAYNNTFDNLNGIYNTTTDAQDSVLLADLLAGEEAPESMIKGAYQSIKTFSTAIFPLASSIINDTAAILHIPSFIAIGALILVVIIVAFGIIYLLLRFLPT